MLTVLSNLFTEVIFMITLKVMKFMCTHKVRVLYYYIALLYSYIELTTLKVYVFFKHYGYSQSEC